MRENSYRRRTLFSCTLTKAWLGNGDGHYVYSTIIMDGKTFYVLVPLDLYKWRHSMPNWPADLVVVILGKCNYCWGFFFLLHCFMVFCRFFRFRSMYTTRTWEQFIMSQCSIFEYLVQIRWCCAWCFLVFWLLLLLALAVNVNVMLKRLSCVCTVGVDRMMNVHRPYLCSLSPHHNATTWFSFITSKIGAYYIN